MKSVTRSQNAVFNIVFSLFTQIATAVSGLILPRLVISAYGSDVNGLISSIIQFLSYISLLEAGIGGVMSASLYKPLANRDMAKVSGIISAAKSFYHKIAVIFIAYIIVLCFVYPHINQSIFDLPYVVSMIIILSISTFMEYYFAIPYVSLITADQHVRIVHIVNTFGILMNVLLSALCIYLGCSIHVVKFVSSLVFAAKPAFFAMYVRKNYKLDYRASGKGELRQRWNGLAHHIAYFIQTSTDVAVITLFMDIKYVSVYSVYYAIVSGVGKIIISVANGSAAGLGNLIALGEKKALNRVVDVFEFVQSSITTVIYVITAMMLLPFIKLYTKGINDVNYADALFGYLLIIAYAIYSVRYIYSTVTLNANRYKETQAGAIAECTSNIIISVLLIKPLGLAGVALGTAVSMFIRCIFDVVYLSKHVVHRPIYKFFKNILINALAAAAAIAVCRVAIDYNVSGWVDWIWKSALTGVISTACAFGIYVLFCKKMVFELFGRLRHLF